MYTTFGQTKRDAALSKVGRGVAPPPEGFSLFGRTVIVMLFLTLIGGGTACLVMLA